MEPQAVSFRARWRRVLSILGPVLLVPPLLIWALWIQTFSANPAAPQARKREIYLGYFPAFLQSAGALSLLTLVLCVLCIVLTVFGLKGAGVPMKIVGILAIIVSSLVIMLQLFSMM